MTKVFYITKDIFPSDLISPYNHIHHADILKILELAREEMLKHLGMPLHTFLEQGLFWVISKIEIQYLREIKANTYSITCEDLQIVGKELKIIQRIYAPTGKIAVFAVVSLCLFGASEKRALKIPPEIIDKFAELGQ